MYIIAKRLPNADIINRVLGDSNITEEHVNMFFDLYENRVHIDRRPISQNVIKDKIRWRMVKGTDVNGAYIFTDIPTGDHDVGRKPLGNRNE